MTLVNSIKADLIEKRLWLVIVLLLTAMVAAVVMMSGGSSSGGAPPPGPPLGAGPLGPAITASADNPNLAISETITGARFQRQGGARDPFYALVGPKASSAQTPATGGGSAPRASAPGAPPGTGAGTGPGSGGGGLPTVPPPTSTPPPSAPTPTPTGPTPVGGTPPKPKSAYRVDFLFGQVPSNTTDPPTPDQLNSLQDINNPPVGTLLPDSTTAVLAYSGVPSNGRSVTFKLKKESIPQGQGGCRPDPSNCQFVDVKVGQYETFDYQQPGGALVRYAVEVKSINKA